MIKNAKSLLPNCIKCGIDITCTEERRMKRCFANYCYGCYREYMKQYEKRNGYKGQNKYRKTEKGKQKIYDCIKKYNKRKLEEYKNSEKYVIDIENKRLKTYIVNKRIGVIKSANRRGIDYNREELTSDYIYQRCVKNDWRCERSGLRMHCGGDIKYNTLSIDRIDNTKGYNKDNIQIVCHMYNIMKSTFTDNECIDFAESLLKHKNLLQMDGKLLY